MQFALIVIAFFVFSLNAVSAPLTYDASLINPLINYEPSTLADAASKINSYIPILSEADNNLVRDQVLSAVVGPETTYIPKPMLVETIDHQTADRIRRGLRKEVVTHTVAQGESLSKIAADYGINVATLLQDNHIDVKDINKIKPGTELAIAPEKSTDSTEWLDKLHEEEQKARDQQEKERKAKLAKNSRGGLTVAKAADGDAPASNGKFRKPISAGCYNGYHWWAIDCPTHPGTSVFASAGGVVEVADGSGYNGGYGKTILINHGNGWETRYAHLSEVDVSSGQTIGSGQLIALSGNTGNSTGPHLHFEVIKNGQRLNPGNYVGY